MISPTHTIASNQQWSTSIYTNIVRRAPVGSEVPDTLTRVLTGYQQQRLNLANVVVNGGEYNMDSTGVYKPGSLTVNAGGLASIDPDGASALDISAGSLVLADKLLTKHSCVLFLDM